DGIRDSSVTGVQTCALPISEINFLRATVAQEVYLSTASHDFSQASMPLTVAKISVGADAFIGARAFVLPGVTIGERSVIGACSVDRKSVVSDAVVSENSVRAMRRGLPRPFAF